jgi:Na+/melibiose symporter-like transporter
LSTAQPLSAARLLGYAAPTVALQAMMVPLLMFLPPTYSQITGMSLAVVGIMFALGRAFEAFSDPLIGALSDRSRHRFGKRRIWMAVGVPIAVVAAWFLVHPSSANGAAYLLLWLVVFYVGWTLVFIPHQTWGGEISNRYDDRTRIAGYRETGAFVGYLLAVLVPLVYWQLWQGVAAPSFPQIVQTIGWFFMLALPVGVLWCFSVVPQGAATTETAPPGWRELFAIPRRNRPFARLMTAYFIDRLAMGTYFYAQPLLIGIALDMQANLLAVSLVNTIAAVLLAPLWVPITNRLGKHRTYCLANIVTMLSYVVLFTAGVGQVWVVMASYILMGLGNGGTMITPPAMAADTADHDELQSGNAQMGGHMAFLAFVFKAGMACGPLLGGMALAWFGYQQTGQAVDAQNLFGIRFAATWLPVVLLIPPLLLMWNFPIDARRHAQIRAELEERRR